MHVEQMVYLIAFNRSKIGHSCDVKQAPALLLGTKSPIRHHTEVCLQMEDDQLHLFVNYLPV